VWTYEVVESGSELEITAKFPRGTVETFSLEEGATPFVAEVTVFHEEGAGLRKSAPLSPAGGVWTIAGCAAGCALHYRFRLKDAARELADVDSAQAAYGCVESPPSAWLLRPTDYATGTTYRFHVRAAAGSRFATGVHPVPSAPDTYGAGAGDLDTAPYSLFGPFRSRTLARQDATIEVAILPGKLALDDAAIDHWVDLSARAVDAFYGRFPVQRALLILVPQTGSHWGETVDGRTLASGGSSILLGIGQAMDPTKVAGDWVLTHEMSHLALPNLPRRVHWLEEGLATYVEPLGRAMIGTIPDTEVWRGLVDGLPNGQPAEGDEGLDRTHTWGRTYWGGALFAFVADLEIRKATHDKMSLRDALRGVLASAGNGEVSKPVGEVLRTADEAVGTKVLEEMYAKWSVEPVKVDLAQTWKDLGVRAKPGAAGVEYDDSAPLAEVRRAMTAPARLGTPG
jgi:hypothetical protein